MQMIDLKGKVALVTGASRGIGAATAVHLAACGARVVLAARQEADLDAVRTAITHQGGEALAIAADVARYDDVANAVRLAEEGLGGLDILVNNAGQIDPIARIAESDPVAWGRIADINYKGVYHGLRAALPGMLARGGGVIVNVSSGAATSPLEGWSHYSSSKAGALMLTRCADREYGAQGVRVLGISPGTVATGMQDAIRASGVNPVSQLLPSAHIPPEWVARAITWLCGEAGAAYAGDDFSLKTDEARRAVGLIR